DNSGQNDDAGAAIMDQLWSPIADAGMRPVFGDQPAALDNIRDLGGLSGESYVDKDLRTLLNDPVNGKFRLRYCGNGSLDACRASLWAVVDQVAAGLAAAQGPDPTTWRNPSRRTGFTPGLIPDTIRATNRPTFQQVLEFARPAVVPPPVTPPPDNDHHDDHHGHDDHGNDHDHHDHGHHDDDHGHGRHDDEHHDSRGRH